MKEKINVLQIGLGFIGGRYKEIEGERFAKYSIKRLENSIDPIVKSPSNKSIELKQLPKEIKAIIVFAYSDLRKENFEILKNTFNLATKLNIKTVIYIGTTAIYDIKDGLTNEKSPHLKYKEYYADTKLRILNALKKKASTFDGSIIALHPSIVFGHGGSWTKTIRNSLMCGKVLLPKKGSGFCNPIHVDDVCQAVDKAIISHHKKKFSDYIISSGIIVPWHTIYKHMQSYNVGKNLETGKICNCEKKHLFYSSYVKNVIYYFLYSRLGALIFGIVKYFKYKKSVKPLYSYSYKFKGLDVYQPSGVYRLLHMKKQIFSIELAKDKLNFSPKFKSEETILESLRD